jgi:hypothetical protein
MLAKETMNLIFLFVLNICPWEPAHRMGHYSILNILYTLELTALEFSSCQTCTGTCEIISFANISHSAPYCKAGFALLIAAFSSVG